MHTSSTPPRPAERSGGRTVAAAEGLTKRYGRHVAVDDLSFEVPAGQVIGLLGPNGAGKTTAMKMLLGLVRPTAGSAHLLGTHLREPGFGHALRRTGALIEAPALYERLTARQNLQLQATALGLNIDATRIDELLELVDLVDRAGDRAGGYSLGMKQRLGIAVALIGDPALVILDEPANGLDPAGIVEIRHLLRRLPERGTTVLVSSHQLAEVEQASDSLLVLARGRLIASGTTDEILRGRESNTFTVRLEASEISAATAALAQEDIDIETFDEAIRVALPAHWSGRDLNGLLADRGVIASELRRDRINLEDAFLDMTANHGPKEELTHA